MNLLQPLRSLNRNRWNLAFFEETSLKSVLSGDYSSVKWMHYADKTRWYADPFILRVTEDEIVLLVEELSYQINRGRLAKIVVDRRTFKLLSMKIVLNLPTHLSFPMILRKDENIIVIPENSASGKSSAYRYDEKTDEMQFIGVVCEQPLTDATILEYGDNSYIIATSLPNPNGNKLQIFEFDNDRLKAQPLYDITFDSTVARNAGSPFKMDGKIYRPAQDCIGKYGKGVIIQEIGIDTKTSRMSFKDAASIYPFNYNYHLGLHTLNIHDGMCVIDARGLLYPHIGRIVRPIINSLRR